jgi:hypothetical protein
MSTTKSTAGQPAGPSDLELTCYGAVYAWLRREQDMIRELDRAIVDADRLDQDLTATLGAERIWITDAGRAALDEDRRARAMEALFGQPWPSVAEVVA